jgi:hypothetical protein
MLGSSTVVLALGAIALLVVLVTAGTAPAGNRSPTSSLAATPGPAEPTAGQGVALTASLENSQKSTFTDVRFVFSLPAGATLVSTTCADYTVTAGQFSCSWGHQLRAGQTATIVFVLRTAAGGASTLSLAGEWTIKEGSQGGNDTFPTNAVGISVLAANDPRKAGGFATTVCTNPATPTLATNQALGPGNPLATSVCAPDLPTLPLTGIVAGITERDHQSGDAGVTQVSEICLPAPGAACGGAAFHFSTPATFTFLIDNKALPQTCGSHFRSTSAGDQHGGGGCQLTMITKVFHDNVRVSTSPSADPRVVSIAFNSNTKTTTIVVKSSENGSWTGG